jgi:peroxiredoxin
MSERGPLDFEGESEEQREEREARWARRRDPDLDGPAGSPDHPVEQVPTPRPPGYSQYGWFIGVVAVLVMGAILINTLRTDSNGSAGPRKGSLAPPFAAPLVFSSFADDADVNVARKAGQGDAGSRPACSITDPGVLNSCRLHAHGPAVLVFTATRGSQCIHQLDVVERLRKRLSGVAFAAIAIRGSRDDLRKLTRRHGWSFPVAFDHDGVLANLYGIAVCPQLTFVRRDGRVADTAVGVVEAAELARRVRALGA